MAATGSRIDEDAVMPIAVVGMAGRYPGDASNPTRLWDMLSEGRSAWSEIPKDRFNIDAFYHPQPERQGTINLRGGHFLKEAPDSFDAPFFSITPNEAKSMDPQQRMCLEVAYEALENAGIPMESVVGSDTSCYVGCFTHDYLDVVSKDVEDFALYNATGTGDAILSNRVSWFFDLQGPSMSVDTACSSSLVALHLGCQSLRIGESKAAIVGGVNYILMPDMMTAMTAMHFLSPDGKSQSFDEKGNGYGRGEGASFVVIKPLADAIRDNDVIRAVIRNTAVNQDGNTPGITLPSGKAQEKLIRTVYQQAKLPLTDTAYFEAHGTGTPAGDPIETSAIGNTFGKARRKGDPILVGSIKSNIGHLEGASGLAGVTKGIFALERAEIPGNIWLDKLNPRILADEWNVTIPTALTPWPEEGPRRISVNSFGYGGTNAHVILDDAYHYLKARGLEGNHYTANTVGSISPASSGVDSGISMGESPAPDNNRGGQNPLLGVALQNRLLQAGSQQSLPKLFVWSAAEQNSVQRTTKLLAEYVELSSEEKLTPTAEAELLGNLAYTLTSRRSILPWKTFAVASHADELQKILAEDDSKPVRSSKAPKLGFVFTGQGAQHYAMGRELMAHEVFLESIQTASAYLVSIGCSWSLIGELTKEESESHVNLPAYSQPMCCAVQVGLIDLLKHWGITPAAVVGHSSGEIAAAYAKGAITREAAWLIAYQRGRLSGLIKGMAPNLEGGMMAVGLGEDGVQPYLARITKGTAVIACINSPSSVTLSGDASALIQLEPMLKADSVFARMLKVETAYHSPHMEVIGTPYLQSMASVRTLPDDPSAPKMFSSVTGTEIANADLGAEYWVANMLNTVRFSQATQALTSYTDSKRRKRDTSKTFVDILIEVGPHGALQGPLKQILMATKQKVTMMSALSRGADCNYSTLQLAGKLFQNGYLVNFSTLNSETRVPVPRAALVDLPSYSWNHSQKFWHESAASHEYRFREHPRKDLLGLMTTDSNDKESRFRNFLKLSENPWMEDHKVHSAILYPAAGMMVMAIEAARQLGGQNAQVESYELRDIMIESALLIPKDEAGVETMLTLKPWRTGSQSDTANWREFSLFSRPGKSDWKLNCNGLISVKTKTASNPLFVNEETIKNLEFARRYKDAEENCEKSETPLHFYESLETLGLQLGPVCRNFTEVKRGDYRTVATTKIPNIKNAMPQHHLYDHLIHPITLDNIIHMVLHSGNRTDEKMKTIKIPTFIGQLSVSAQLPNEAGTVLKGFSVGDYLGINDFEGSVYVSDDKWEKPLVTFERLRCTEVESGGNDAGQNKVAEIRKLAGKMVWKEDVEHVDRSDIKTVCSKAVPAEDTIGSEVIDDLEVAAFIYMKRVIKKIPKSDAAKLEPYMRKFYNFMEQICQGVEHGTIDHISSVNHHAAAIDWLHMKPAFEQKILDRVAASSIDGRLLCQHGEQIVPILKGEIQALDVLNKDELLTDFEDQSLGREQMYAQLKSYLELLVHKDPNMKFLEIGGRTGGTTERVLPALGGADGSTPHFQSYTFTDVNPQFLSAAEQKFSTWASSMICKPLFLQEDPVKQGFEAGSYDVIIAQNLTHAMTNLDQVVKNARTLLKPGGTLIVGEVTRDLLYLPMILGSLPAWWAGEKDGRQTRPTLTSEKWDEVFRRNGFGGIDLLLNDWQDPRTQCSSIMATIAQPVELEHLEQDVLIIESNTASKEANSLATKLSKQLQSVGIDSKTLSLAEAHGADFSGKACLMLAELEQPLLFQVSEKDFDLVKRLIQSNGSLLWVTRGAVMQSANPHLNLVTGLSRVVRGENPSLAMGILDLDPETSMESSATVRSVDKILRTVATNMSRKLPDWEFAVRNNMIMVPRLDAEPGMNDLIKTLNVEPKAELSPFKQEDRALKLTIGAPGALETLHFVDDDRWPLPLAGDDVELDVKATGINFEDVLVAMGKIHDSALPSDCSGVITRVGKNVTNFKVGDKVMTWSFGAFGNFVRAPSSMIHPVPEGMDFETAASIPLAYCTAYSALMDCAKARKGEKVLIHSAAGAIGQACLSIANHIGAEVFATVSSDEKKKLVMERYGVHEDHIFNSRDLSFATGIKRMTNGDGVDVIVNSLAGEAMRQSWHCLAWFGRFVELDKKDITSNTGLDMEPFLRNISFTAVNIVGEYRHSVKRASRLLSKAVGLIQDGHCKPVGPLSVMNFSQIEEAFKLLKEGNHLGKIVLKAQDDDQVKAVPRKFTPAQFSPDATYVMSGGLGGLGKTFSKWMVDHGAKHIAFLSRSGASKPEAKEILESLHKNGIDARAYQCDIGNAEHVERSVAQCQKEMPPIKGVIQAAMSLSDSAFHNMTHADWSLSVNPKAPGTWNLHQCLPKDMDFFVMLSSSSGVMGIRGQGNYAAGNTFQDALANYRQSQGLPAVALDVGMIFGVGYVAENPEIIESLKSHGFIGIYEDEFLAMFQAAVTGKTIRDKETLTQVITGLGTGGILEQNGSDMPYSFEDGKFAYLRLLDVDRDAKAAGGAGDSVSTILSQATSVGSAAESLTEVLVGKLAKWMMISAEDIDSSKPVSSYGVDSLVAVEIRSWAFRDCQADISIFEVMSNNPITHLGRLITEKSKLVPSSVIDADN